MNSSIGFIMVWIREERELLGTALPSGLASEGTCTMTFTGTYIAMFAECGEAAFQYFKCKFQRDKK